MSKLVTEVAPLSIFIVKDEARYMAKCVELDLVTEMDTPEQAFCAIIEMLKEYAEDYKKNEQIYLKSPNRAHHKIWVDRILACKDDWELLQLVNVKYGSLYI